MKLELSTNPRLDWLTNGYLRPYVFMRAENRISNPGELCQLDWFKSEILTKDPLRMDEVDFADMVLKLESRAFAASNMAMPRWVFYDCAIMPGMVAGFAIHRSQASAELLKLLEPRPETEWLPVSLFIVIPSVTRHEWVAHNLCSVNSLLPPQEGLYGLGFLTKAFGIWYANIEVLCGITQWSSPAVRLHTHYGDFEVLTAYTPVHSHARTMTYRMVTDSAEWSRFFKAESEHEMDLEFESRFEEAGFDVDPKNDENLKSFQRLLETGGTRYYLNPRQIRNRALDSALQVYKPRLFKG